MKKIIVISLIAGIMCCTGCSGTNTEAAKNNVVMNTQTVDDVIAKNIENSKDVSSEQSEIPAETNDSINNVITDNAEAVAQMTDSSEVFVSDKVLSDTTYDSIDYDLSSMSGTVVYSQIYDMMEQPDAYVDKVVKMTGFTTYFQDPSTGNEYYSCVVPDATACCAQGFEFVLNDNYEKYTDYPGPDQTVTLVGIFSTYMEGDLEYITLKNAELVES